jgi:hypothetical protein
MSTSIAALFKKQRVLTEGISQSKIKIDAFDADLFDLRTKKSLEEDERKALWKSLIETDFALIAMICPTQEDRARFAGSLHMYRQKLKERPAS